MGKGLDELIESLLTEIAFSGSRGCRVTNLLAAIKSFYSDDQGADASLDVAHHGTSPDDLVVATKVWRWLVARPDVSVGIDGQFNHLSLEAVLDLPEDEDDQEPSDSGPSSSSVPTVKPEAGQSGPSRGPRQSGKGLGNVRPRLYVSEERQWRILTGHGPDFKRVPTFEWRALVDIASTKEKGILQGDLVRLTGQDKRSLPTRTDALAKKGYIIKQPVLLRGCRSSKIWLAQFAEKAQQDADRDGLQHDEIDLSPETLTKDLDPVPFSHKWNGEKLDYLAIAQAFVAVVKAWGLIRYCDARAKLDVEERVPQMRALAKTSRWLTSINSVTFVAARFSNSSRLFKDCVKFLREPTPAEWKIFRTTPKARLNIPSQRVGARGVASRARHEALTKTRGKSKKKRASSNRKSLDPPIGDNVLPSLWTPQKPITNTVFEIIKRSGPAGSSNASIGRQTICHAYRKYTAALNAAISFPNAQPTHLGHLAVASNLTRIGKTMTYQFFAMSEMDPSALAALMKDRKDKAEARGADAAGEAPPEKPLNPLPVVSGIRAFSQPVESKFAPLDSSSLSSLSRVMPSIKIAQAWNSKRKRKRDADDAQAEPPKRRGRPPKVRPQEAPTAEIVAEESPSDPKVDTKPSTNGAVPMEAQMDEANLPINEEPVPVLPHSTPETFQLRPPGVYRGSRTKLDNGQKRKGRPKRSCVVIFRSDKLKDPSFLGLPPNEPDGELIGTSNQGKNVTDTATSPSNIMDTDGGLQSTVPEPTPTKEISSPKSRGPRKGKPKSFKCDKCGNSWRNSNGLDYHLKRSQTTCNADFVPPPPQVEPPGPDPKQRDARPLAYTSPKRRQNTRGSSIDIPPSAFSKAISMRIRPVRNLLTGTISEGTPKPASTRGSILLQDLQADDITDRTLEQSDQSAPYLKGICPPYTEPQELIQGGHVRRKQKNSHNYGESGQKAINLHQPHSQSLSIKGSSPLLRVQGIPKEAREGAQSVTSSSIVPNMAKSASASPKPITHEGKILARTGNDIIQRDQNSGAGSLALLKTTRTNNATSGAQRRERTSNIIEYLLDQNEGVFPGQKSLYLALVSIWTREYSDLAPPDRRMCQSIVGKLDKAGVLKQLHFLFKDGQGNLQDCAILVKVRENDDQSKDLSVDPKVVATKEKMREMFPETYVPEAFSLSEKDIELFDALSSKYKGPPQPENDSTPRQNIQDAQEVEVLQYPMPVMVDIPINETPSKRPREDEDGQDAKPPKKLRFDVQGLEKVQNSRKPNKRRESEFWDSGKMAIYIWSQKQNHVHRWNQTSACLQDPATGAWSWKPKPNIKSILSSVKSTQENDAYLRQNPFTSCKSQWARPSHGEEDSEDIDEDAMSVVDHSPRKTYNTDLFVEPSTSTSFAFEEVGSEDDDEDIMMEDTQQVGAIDNNATIHPGDVGVRFSPVEHIRGIGHGSWPRLRPDFFESHVHGFSMVGSMPSYQWFQKENLPQNIDEIPRTIRASPLNSWADPLYGKFMRDVTKIEMWEQSVEGTQILSHGSVAPDYIFISLSSDESKANVRPFILEWPSKTQYTGNNMPDEIMNASPEDDDFGLPNPSMRIPRVKKVIDSPPPKTQMRRTRTNRILQDDLNAKSGFNVEYKTRLLTSIPRQPRGRSTHPRPINGEGELIAAFVVFRTLIGGVDQTVDLGLVMKHFPEMSLSALRKFWPRVTRERKTYVDALTSKFQSSFLEAYERGDFPPLDYDNLGDYDWGSLIAWTSKLETHEDVNLPMSRHALNETYQLENPIDEVVDWREIWYSQASVYNRIEAAAGESISIPIPSVQYDETQNRLARSWVRSLCCTSIRGADSPEKIRTRLLQLANGDEASTNRLLGKVIAKLRLDKLVVRAKGKIMGQSFRLHAQFVKQLEKMSRAEKFTQATAFKAQLDEHFREDKEFLLPYASDDGTIMAIINLQAAGRIRTDATEIPRIPFGFEPGNYEGRLFPKTYYHFQVRLIPTQTYMYDEDMPVLRQAASTEPPTRGPRGEIPIWVDFFGKLDRGRWTEYLSMTVFALATRGPLTPRSAAVLLKPVIDEFEAELIMGWLDGLGLLHRVEGSAQGAAMAEWWWLVVGRLINAEGKDRAVAG